MLAIGGAREVQLISLSTGAVMMKQAIADNASCVRTVQGHNHKPVLVFGTYDGRINYLM